MSENVRAIALAPGSSSYCAQPTGASRSPSRRSASSVGSQQRPAFGRDALQLRAAWNHVRGLGGARGHLTSTGPLIYYARQPQARRGNEGEVSEVGDAR